jgi:hypothetical protein
MYVVLNVCSLNLSYPANVQRSLDFVGREIEYRQGIGW